MTGYLVTKIIDEGKGINLNKWASGKFKSFNFTGLGNILQQDETSGVGVGLSTASSLSKALGGYLTLTSGKTKSVSGTEATFFVKTT